MLSRKMKATLKTSFLIVGILILLLLYSFSLNNVSTRIRPKFSQLQQNRGARYMIDDIKEQLPNLPIEYWEKNKKYVMNFNRSCASFPNLFKINYNNELWQTLRTSNGTFHLYNAYLDLRVTEEPTVRILAMVDRIQLSTKTYCQFWFDSKRKPVITKVLYYKYIWNKGWGNYRQGILQPYLITCKLPFNALFPVIVSLVEHPCNTSTVALNIIDNRVSRVKDFAVCVKGLNFPYNDFSVRIAEWIELLHLLGVDKIFFYNLAVHPNVERLLDYYQQKGKVHVTQHMLAGDQPNNPLFRNYYIKNKLVDKRQNELIPYNDCFYKHMYEYKYIVLLDTDEVIMPLGSKTWRELMDSVEEMSQLKDNERGSYRVQNVYFLDDLMHDHAWFSDIPQYMHMLQHVYRTKNFTKPGAYVKSFFNTKKTLTLHNHNPMHCIGYYCNSYSINTTMAQLQHYRSDCVNELRKSCISFKANSVEDQTIWKFKEELIHAVTKTLGDLNLIPEDKNRSNHK